MANYEKYRTESSSDASQYEFISLGYVRIEKRVQYTLLHVSGMDNTYNCAFGDWDPKQQKLNCNVISSNGDRNKVLATVIGTIFHFTARYPDRIIHFSGSNETRTNLYGRIIYENFNELNKDFYIFGVKYETINGEELGITYPFAGKERYNYNAYLIKRR